MFQWQRGGLVSCVALFLLMTTAIDGSHFRGAHIWFSPVYNEVTDTMEQMEISWRIAWRRSWPFPCTDESLAMQPPPLISGEGNMRCLDGPCFGFSAPMDFVCTDYSAEEDWTAGVGSAMYQNPPTSFRMVYSSAAWITLQNGGGAWSLLLDVNLTRREDTGRPNSSPQTATTPIVRLQRHCNHTVEIPVSDPDGDEVRCRFASGYTECGGVCAGIPGATINSADCTISYSATGAVGWYAVALMLEDYSPTSLTPLSMVPLQFLIDLFESESPCSEKPKYVGQTRVKDSCVGIPFNTTYHEPIVVQTGSPDVAVITIDTASPTGLVKSGIEQLSGTLYSMNITWTPVQSQGGENIFCFTAEDNTGQTADQQCIFLVGGVEAPLIVDGSFSPAPGSDLRPDVSIMFSVKFDKPFVRPGASRQTLIRVHRSDSRALVASLDVSISQNVDYFSALDGTIQFAFPDLSNQLVEKESYYIVLEPGVARGLEFCGPESPAVRDPTTWYFTVKDITPPVCRFGQDSDSKTAGNVTIYFYCDEVAHVQCTLQSPTDSLVVPCGDFYNGTTLVWTSFNLQEGSHYFYVSAQDVATPPNIAASISRFFYIDKTPPVVTITSTPQPVSNTIVWNIISTCNESPCSKECDLVEHLANQTAAPSSYRSCYGTNWMTLREGYLYSYFVRGTDSVQNVGKPAIYTWEIDLTAPIMEDLGDVSLACGDPFSPEVIGSPQVTDNRDVNPEVTYEDVPQAGCIMNRIWTARDAAGNTIMRNQGIHFTNPKPAVWNIPTVRIVPCGPDENQDVTVEELIAQGLLSHPCNRSMTLELLDSVARFECGITFTRTWRVTDDCQNPTSLQQTLRVLDDLNPVSPPNGQLNSDLFETLEWPEYPGAITYRLFVWEFQTPRPSTYVVETSSRIYRPSEAFRPDTRYLWQIEYILQQGSDDTLGQNVIPGTVWGFQTRAYPDLTVTSVTLPNSAFTGQDVTVEWTVENIGSLGTSGFSWYDSVYWSQTQEFSQAILIRNVWRQGFVDPQDGYTGSYTWTLPNDAVGYWYIFIRTDIYSYTDDSDTSNNIRRSDSTMEVRLTPPPDLQVTDIVVQESTFSGQDEVIRYTVENKGTGTTDTPFWQDQVWMSSDSVINSGDYLLATVHKDSGLVPNGKYEEILTVTIPHKVFGDFLILVRTDASNSVYEHLNEDNNIGQSEGNLTVTLTAPADLLILSFTSPTEVTTDEQLHLEWTVQNSGYSATFETYWVDFIYMVPAGGGTRYSLGSKSHTSRLEPDDTYTESIDISLNQAQPTGTYDITLHVDYYGHVFEHTYTQNNLQMASIDVVQRLPDLELNSIQATVDIDLTNEIAVVMVTWTVQNKGQGRTKSVSWYDAVYLSETADQWRGLRLGTETYRTPDGSGLASQVQYQVTEKSFTLPLQQFGQKYIHVYVDYTNRQVEESEDIDTNIKEVQITIPVRSSELRVTHRVISTVSSSDTTTVFAGRNMTATFNVTNNGNWLTDGARWIDRIYVSKVPYLDDTAFKLGSQEHNPGAHLKASDEYQVSITTVLQDSFWGDSYILISVAEGLWEYQDAADRVLPVSVVIEEPPRAELRVLSIVTRKLDSDVVVRQASSGQLLEVKWTVINIGNSMVEPEIWDDAVVLTPSVGSVTHPDARVLAVFSSTGQLDFLQTYTVTKTIVLSTLTISGTFYISIIPDFEGPLKNYQAMPIDGTGPDGTGPDGTGPGGTGPGGTRPGGTGPGGIGFDNATLITIPKPPKPEITITYDGSIPDPIGAGRDVTVSFTVKNNGGTITETSWTDAVYLDRSVTAGETLPKSASLLVAEQQHIGALPNGGSYAVQIVFRIPADWEGPLYVYLLFDSGESISDLIGSKIVSNVSDVVMVTALEFPDLSLTFNQENITLSSGEPFDLMYSVKNNGSGPTLFPWFDTIYLSEDAIIDPFDVKLKTVIHNDVLNPGESKMVMEEVDIPFDITTTSLYFIVEVDEGGRLFDSDESNNLAFTLATIRAAFTSDIAVESVTLPGQLNFGSSFAVDWVVRNRGVEDVQGYKCDTAYLSDDNEWSIDDLELGQACGRVTLNAYQNNPSNDLRATLTANVPPLPARDFTGIVRSRSNIRDFNLTNNIGVATSPSKSELPTITLESPITVTMAVGGTLYFHLPDVEASETLVVSVTSDTDADFNEVYVRFDDIPSLLSHDASGREFLRAHQTATVAQTNEGSYYILVMNTGRSDGSQTDSQVTVLVKYAQFEVLDVFPRVGAPLGTVTLRVSGTLIPDRVIGFLTHADGTQRPAWDVYHFSSTEVYLTFYTRGLKVGNKYDLKLMDIERSMETEFTEALQIIDGVQGALKMQIDSQARLLVGETGTITVSVQNSGDTDVVAPIMVMEVSGDGEIRPVDGTLNTLTPGWTRRHLFMASPIQGPGGILSPGTASQLAFELRPTTDGGRARFKVYALPSDGEAENPYISKKPLLKPLGADPEAWEVTWNNFIRTTGRNMRTFSTSLSKTASQLSMVGRRVTSIDDLVDLHLDLADGTFAGRFIHTMVDLTLGSEDSGFYGAEVRRHFSPIVSHRKYRGPFGRGWISPYWDTQLHYLGASYAVLQRGPERLWFRYQSRGVFIKEGYGTLRRNGSVVIFTETETAVASHYHFDATSGRLMALYNDIDDSALTFAYSDSGTLERMTSSEGYELRVLYNNAGLVDSITLRKEGQDVNFATYVYDLAQEYLVRVEEGERTLEYTYTTDGAVNAVMLPDGRRDQYHWERTGQFKGKSTYSPDGELENELIFTTVDGLMWQSTERPSGQVTDYIYDDRGNAAYIKSHNNPSFKIVRDYNGLNKKIYLNGYLVREELFSEQDMKYTIIDANKNQIEIGLHDNSDVKFIKDGNGNMYEAKYANDLLDELVYPDGSTEKFVYDENRKSAGYVTRAGDRISLQADADGNIVRKDVPGETQPTTFRYDDRGYIVEAQNAVGSVQLEYTDAGLPRKVVYSNGRQLEYTYDDNNRRTGLSDTQGYNIRYQYDTSRRLTDVIDDANGGKVLLHVEYDTWSRIEKRETGNGCRDEYTYSSTSGQLVSIATICDDGTQSVIESEITYHYDNRNRRVEVETPSGTWHYQYDAQSQLISWTSPDMVTTKVTYDKNQNRRSVTVDGDELAYGINKLNQYTSFDTQVLEYDQNGNLIEIRDDDSGDKHNYYFDPEGRVTGFNNGTVECTFVYDAMGNLHEKRCGADVTSYLVDPFGILYGNNILAEFSNGGSGKYYVHAPDVGLVSMMMMGVSNESYYYHFDAIGSTTLLTSGLGDVLNRYEYAPFGESYRRLEAVENMYQYVGQWGVRAVQELEGVYQMRARYYTAVRGRFWSPDPEGFGGKSPNLYAYADNKPTDLIDPRGTFLLPVIAAGAVIGGVIGGAAYIIQQVVTGNEIKPGELAGRVVYGAIVGGVAGSGVGLGALGAAGVGAGAGLTGSIVEQAIDNSWSWGKTIGGTLTGAIGGAIGSIVPKIPIYKGRGATAFGKIVGTTFKKTVAGLNKTGKQLIANAIQGRIIGVPVRKVVNWFIKEAVPAIQEGISDAWDATKDAWDAGTDAVGDWIDDASDTIHDLIQDGTELYEEIKDNVEESWDDFKDDVSDTWEDIKDKVEDTWEDVKDTAEDIGDFFDDVADDISDWFDETADDVQDWFDDATDWFDDTIDDISDDISDFFEDFTDWIISIDPNDMIGPRGFGAANFVALDREYIYKIRFENDVNATAPAQRVVVTTQLNEHIRAQSFRLLTFGWGNFSHTLERPAPYIQENFDFTEETGYYIRVVAGIDIVSHSATWTIQTLDPATGRPPTDPGIGFLPPNPTNGTDGQGFMTYRVRANRETPNLARVEAKASIVFDQNEPIETPVIFNTIDSAKPQSNVAVINETLPSGILAVDITSEDEGAGVQHVNVYMQTDDGWELIEGSLLTSVTTLDLSAGGSYRIGALAVDNVGNSANLDELNPVDVYVPEPEVNCDGVNNCSGSGLCTGPDLCSCDPGLFGANCSLLMPPLEPPVVTFIPAESTEDSAAVLVTVSARVLNNNTETRLVFIIRNAPPEITFSTGTNVSDGWTVTDTEIRQLNFTTERHWHGTFTLQIEAKVIEGSEEASRTISYPVTIAAVADPVTLTTNEICLEKNTTMASIEVTLTQEDKDGSETLELYVTNLPDDVYVSNYSHGSNSTWSHTPEAEVVLVNITAAEGFLYPISFNLTAVSIETSNGDKYEYSRTFNLESCPEVTTPEDTSTTGSRGSAATDSPGISGTPGDDITMGTGEPSGVTDGNVTSAGDGVTGVSDGVTGVSDGVTGVSYVTMDEVTQNITTMTTTTTTTAPQVFSITFRLVLEVDAANCNNPTWLEILIRVLIAIHTGARSVTINFCIAGSADVTYNVNYDSPVDAEETSESANLLAAHIRNNGDSLIIGGENVTVLGQPSLITMDEDGSNRTIPIDSPCFLYDSQKLCQNRGVCVVNGDQAVCACTQHYVGTFCETDRDDRDYTTIYIVIGVVAGIIVVVSIYICYVLQKQKKAPRIENNKQEAIDNGSFRDYAARWRTSYLRGKNNV